jgi:hypothetical protein
MRDVIYGIVFMSIVFGLAALLLTALDKVALKHVANRARTVSREAVHSLSLCVGLANSRNGAYCFTNSRTGAREGTDGAALLCSGLAGLVVLNFLFGRRTSRNQSESEEHSCDNE